jgi:hypothetical protein
VSRTQIVIERAPLATRFVIREVIFITPELKYLKGYHNDSAIPEKISNERRLSTRLIVMNLPKA